MSINIRSMAIASLEDIVEFMKTFSNGNDFSGDTYKEGEFLKQPMLRLRYGYVVVIFYLRNYMH